MRHLALLAVFTVSIASACGSSPAPPPKTNADRAGDADGSPSTARETADDAGAGAGEASDAPPLAAGWVTVDSRTGNVEAAGRDAAMKVLRQSPGPVLVKLDAIVEECTSSGGTHVFFVPAFTDEKPFTTAHLGGHGIVVAHGTETLTGAEGLLFVAAVETHPAASFGNGRGWCLEKAPRYDADVLALVPVRSQGEGMRLLTALSR